MVSASAFTFTLQPYLSDVEAKSKYLAVAKILL
jgi:hypothetical protein